ncbi:unnamed protein product [Brassicogethes aeneus]|uniref:DUF4211 domain-containing protein n=1 Tax=Brassicogethes aeneus TaxID=1431903 RepID=A0A9P0BCV7_BRAAE|nr:unnamed protein product [Brassicogethes aeneus]
MDPVGPWSAYAQYSRAGLAGVQGTAAAAAAAGDLHHHLSTTAAAAATGSPVTTTAQLLPGGFLPPTPVAYEAVFSPFALHHAAAGAKPSAHYVQHRQALAQAQAQAQAVAASKQGDGEFQAPAFFEQNPGAGWPQNSPFGILPHESVVATTTATGKSAYENFSPAHFAAAQSLNHLNSQLAANAKTGAASARAQSPQVSTASSKNTTQNSNFFHGQPNTFAESSSTSTKTFTSSNNSTNLQQQSCIVTSPNTASGASKEYRIPQAPTRSFLTSPNNNSSTRTPIEKNFSSKNSQSSLSPGQNAIQTKAQTKIYPELQAQAERNRPSEEATTQNSPISFSIMDSPGRLNYSGSNSSGKRPPQFQHNYRHYQQPQPNNTSEEFQRPKSGSEYPSNGQDCNVVVPRRPSPLQAHSQASPIGHAQSPAYPLYNSPLNSMSSPQQQQTSSGTSPLDASLPRSSSTQAAGQNVAYPSVIITRALNSDNKSFPERYERNAAQHNSQIDSQTSSSQQANCNWNEQRQRKFQNNQYAGAQQPQPGNNVEIARHIETQRNLGNSERQQTYFDSTGAHQVTLQDLSSCRGDPMSIVKNLQQQQSCQVQEIKQEIKKPVKRRLSNEKPPAVPADVHVTNRIPPPAHTPASQQQQNGAYFDFERWNLPPPQKIFATQAMHQQHQGLMVPHPHGHPGHPLPYFAPFHIPPPSEFNSNVELTTLTTYSEQQQQHQSAAHYQQPQPAQEDQPKVVVPNIEEELNFLSEGTVRAPSSNSASLAKANNSQPNAAAGGLGKPDAASGPGAGFMSSYLKFLQGERDSSPPPIQRGGRKTNWTRTAVKQEGGVAAPETNGVVANKHPTPNIPPVTPIVPPITRLSQGDPQDDPRYFPLPKERKRNSFDSDSDNDSDDGFFSSGRKSLSMPPCKSENKERDRKNDKERSSRKGRPCKPGGPTERRRLKQMAKDRLKYGRDRDVIDEELPKRETSKRAAKEKKNLHALMKDEEPDEPAEFQDSDSDPAWTPLAKTEEEDIVLPLKKNKKNRHGLKQKKGVKNLIAAAAQGAGINESDMYSSDLASKKHKIKAKVGGVPPTLEDNIAASMHNAAALDENPFKTGEFLAIKADLNQEWPPIWRVDGKTLLQKYEPFEQNGCTLYRNISTYTSWTSESKKQYISIPVKCKSQGSMETIVEFLKKEITIIDPIQEEKCMKEFEFYQDNFEVYIQTLISQALDSNFLMEIFSEKDEYFLLNVRTIDEIAESKKSKLLSILRWPSSVQAAVCTWPCFNVIREVSDAQLKKCHACGKKEVSVRVLMYGQPYNSTTLEGCQPDPTAMNEKDFLMCRLCASRVELSNKITHQKYLMYIECAKKVTEKRGLDPNKDTTCILNELLADEAWLTTLFFNVRQLWAEIDCIEHSLNSNVV